MNEWQTLGTIAAAWLVATATAVAALWIASRRPITPADRRCAEIDQELVLREEQERRKAEVSATAKWCREDERETIAAAIEAECAHGHLVGDKRVCYRCQSAARIARQGGQP